MPPERSRRAGRGDGSLFVRPSTRGRLVAALMWCGLCAAGLQRIVNAQHVAPPPPVRVDQADAPAPNTASLSGLKSPGTITRSGSPMPFAFGDGQTEWIENAENGAGNVIDGTSTAYPLIQSDAAGQGTYAFHLAHPAPPGTNWFELNVNIDVGAQTKLFFLSRLGYATTAQIAKVLISTNGGSSWTQKFSQAGSGGAGEGAFSLRQIDLGAEFNGQQIRIRFSYEFPGGSYYPQTTANAGWLVDDIQIGATFQKSLWSVGTPTPSEVLYVQLINRSRSDASVEAARLRDITDADILGAYAYFHIAPANIVTQYAWHVANGYMDETAQPLAFHAKLNQAARLHTQDMFNNQFQGHVSSGNPVPPIQPGDRLSNRLARVGYTGHSSAAENVFAYSEHAEYGHAGFEVDWGDTTNSSGAGYNPAFVGQGMQNPPGHRLTLHNGDYNEIGVGVINGTSGGVGPQLVTQDLAVRPGVAYICGVVYDDLDGNTFYSAASDTSHEGRGGIRVDVDGSQYYCVTSNSGAYAIPVTSNGTYEVTFSGPDILSFSTFVTVSNLQNVALDHDPLDAGYAAFAAAYGLSGGPDDDDDQDSVSNAVEYVVAGMNPTRFDANTLFSTAYPGGGTVHLTVFKRAGVTDLELTARVSRDLVRWFVPGTLPGTTIVSEDASHLTVSGEGTLNTVFFAFDAE